MTPGRPTSLRRRLLLLLLGGYLSFAIVVVLLLHRHTHHEVDELFDEQLRQISVNLLLIAEHWHDAEPLPASPVPQIGRKRFRFQIMDTDGRLRFRSPEAPLAPARGPDGYTDHNDRDGHWREMRLTSEDGEHQVWVAEHHGYRDKLIQETIAHVLLPLVVGLPFLGLWVWLATGRGLAPLALVTRELQTRGPEHLARLAASQVPAEVQPMVGELNRLLAEVDHALNAERRFTADVAHELRTPLAALHTQSQVALRARSDTERQHALEKLKQGLNRSIHLVEQMLVLARLDPERGLPDKERHRIVLGELAERVCADLGHLILEKHLEFDLDTQAGLVIIGQQDWLSIMMRNLVDNAIRYTPEQGQVQVRVYADRDGSCCFQVTDNGPGIPEHARQDALARFHRLDQSGKSGSGLGFSIVTRVAELHGAHLELETAPGGGLAAQVRFRPA
ncbi:ATP-binding protein [Azovibrio restrictus]|uniref:ATP-binding protein n=1 Tax=Azovibrio restrictus TaxID=146938 RepID=UPI000410D187|nr:ATP-binding protein [Azovibrio restrictus]